ncbi:MAG: hypothetical protein GX131_07725 [candidate division WS1 bacterium]|jgi:hypothetical protein|nr:hypothetical protein [candidate division WS1 bacterium]
MTSGALLGGWYLLCLVLLVWPMRKLGHYRETSRAALLMAVPWAIIVAGMMGGMHRENLTLDFIQAAAGLPLVYLLFWEWGLVFLLLPFTIVQWLATGEKLLNSGKWLEQQFADHFRAQPRIALILSTSLYLPWLLWVIFAARLA